MRTSSVRHPRRRVIAGCFGIMFVLVVSGCAQLREPRHAEQRDPAPVAEPQATIDCRSEPSSAPWLGSTTPDPSIPVPGRVPEGFEASAALRCDIVDVGEGADGPGVVAEVTRFEGDLEPLLSALAEPDDAVPPNLACTADMEIVPALWLEGSDGMVVPVHYPRDACGKTKPATRDALDELQVTSVKSLPDP